MLKIGFRSFSIVATKLVIKYSIDLIKNLILNGKSTHRKESKKRPLCSEKFRHGAELRAQPKGLPPRRTEFVGSPHGEVNLI